LSVGVDDLDWGWRDTMILELNQAPREVCCATSRGPEERLVEKVAERPQGRVRRRLMDPPGYPRHPPGDKAHLRLRATSASTSCHALQGEGAAGKVGGSFDRLKGSESPWIVLAAMWNRSFLMALKTESQSRAWPQLTPEETADLLAFLARK
jgi:hypothetical protein